MIDTPDFNQDPKNKPNYLFDPSEDKGPADHFADNLQDAVLPKSLDTIPNIHTTQDRILEEVRTTNDLLKQILDKMDGLSSCLASNTNNKTTKED